MSSTALEPPDAATAAGMLADAARAGRPVVPVGHGTKLHARSLDAAAVLLSSTHLTRGLEHYAGDLVATVPAGATLHETNRTLAAKGQWLPLDPRFAPDATIGGIVGTNDSGPRRHRYGTPRDLIIGIEVALTSGSVVHAGGRVVKNVAGYDLARLFCGSRGSLGLITSVTFKLAPLPPASRTLIARFTGSADAAAAALRVAASPLTPSTIELVSPEPRLLIRFESTSSAAGRMADDAATLLRGEGANVSCVDGEAEAAAWAEYDGAGASRTLSLHVAVLPTTAGSLLGAVEQSAAARGAAATVVGRAGLGVFLIDLSGDAESVLWVAARVRDAVHALGGHVQVAHAAEALREAVRDLHDGPGSAALVGEAVKRRFDPAGILPYWWPGHARD